MPWTEWSISKAMAEALIKHLDQSAPRRILEIGSGASTVLFAAYTAWQQHIEVVTLEHDESYGSRTAKALADLCLADRVELQQAPLRKQRFADGNKYPWYDVKLSGEFDFVFIDGPPMVEGRQGVLFAVFPYLNPAGWEAWLDDGMRTHERQCVELWQQHFDFSASLIRVDGKGAWVLRGGQHQGDVR